MPVFEDEAIVIRQYTLSDSDRIIHFLTRANGKVRAVAKGARKPQIPGSGHLEPLNHIRLEFYLREGKDLSQIRRTELIHSYLGRNPSLSRMAAFHYFAEICNELVPDNQGNSPFFRVFLASLNAGETCGIQPALIRYFEVWCLRLSGLLPNYAYCSDCGKCVKDDEFFAWLDAGQARCNACARGCGVKIGAAASTALVAMGRLSPEQFVSLYGTEEAIRDMEPLTQKLLELHLEKKLKSYRILKEAL